MSHIPVVVLGATGAVGQNLVALLQQHPQFKVTALAASERSVGKRYGDLWRLSKPLNESIAQMAVRPCIPDMEVELVFSALDSSVAGEIESRFAHAGYRVISNSSNHRMDPDVPLIIPEVNGDTIKLIERQSTRPGCIITNPNCVVVGLAMALKPLIKWGIEEVSVTTLQAISGAGFSGLSPEEINDNVIPHIHREEEKIESETKKILGPMQIVAQCNRVPVSNGHTLCVQLKLKETVTEEMIHEAWRSFEGVDLLTAPKQPIQVMDNAPQPKEHLKPLELVVGKLKPTSSGGWKFVALCDNQIRGAAGCALLNAELLQAKYPNLSYVC